MSDTIIHVPDYKFERNVSVGIRNEHFDIMITNHGQRIGALFPNEIITVKSVTVGEEVSIVEGDILKQEIN